MSNLVKDLQRTCNTNFCYSSEFYLERVTHIMNVGKNEDKEEMQKFYESTSNSRLPNIILLRQVWETTQFYMSLQETLKLKTIANNIKI